MNVPRSLTPGIISLGFLHRNHRDLSPIMARLSIHSRARRSERQCAGVQELVKSVSNAGDGDVEPDTFVSSGCATVKVSAAEEVDVEGFNPQYALEECLAMRLVKLRRTRTERKRRSKERRKVNCRLFSMSIRSVVKI